MGDKAAHYDLLEHADFIFYNVTDGLEAMNKIHLQIHDRKITRSVDSIVQGVGNMEDHRWPITMSLLIIFSLFCVLIFIGAIAHSIAILIIFSVCGFFSSILLLLLASVYATMVADLANFCHEPTLWAQNEFNHSFNLSEDITKYFLLCNEQSMQNPLKDALQDSENAVFGIQDSLKRVNKIARQYYEENQ